MNSFLLTGRDIIKFSYIRILGFITFVLLIIIFAGYHLIDNDTFKFSEAIMRWKNEKSKTDCRNNKKFGENNFTDIHFNGSNNSLNDLNPIQLWLTNKNVTYQPYLDHKFAKNCETPSGRQELFNVIKFWTKLSAEHDLPWWLISGSLIGALRHKDMVPWDSDIDIGIPTEFESLIRKISTPRKQISSKKVNIVVRPGQHCPYNAPRQDCSGNNVTSQTDGCAFCGPLARVFYRSSKRMDIYLYNFKFDNGNLIAEDEGFFEYMKKPPIVPVDWLLPLRNCSFMGLTLQCPRQSERYLIHNYKTYKSFYKCFNKKWVEI